MPDDIHKSNSINDKDIENEYRAEVDRLKLVFEITKYGLFDWNFQTKEIYTNSIFLNMLGYKDGEIIVSPEFWPGHLHPEDLLPVNKIFDEYNHGIRESHETEYRIRSKSGEWRWVLSSGKLVKRDKDGKPLRMIGTHSDITESKNAATKLIESEEKFYKVFQMSPEPSAITTINDGRYIEVNDAFLDTYGYTREEVLNKTSRELGTWDPSLPRDRIIKLIKQNGSCKDIEVSGFKKDRSLVFGLFSASIIQLRVDPVLFSVFKDITERKNALDLLRMQKDISVTLAGISELKDLGNYVLNTTTQLEGVDSGGLYIRNIETGKLNLISHYGVPDSFIESVSSFEPDSRQAQIVAKGESICLSYSEFDVNNKEGIKLLFIIPIKHENKVIANLNLASHTHFDLPQGVRDGLEAVAGMLGDSIARVRTETAIREINARVNSIMESPKDICIYSLDTHYCFTSFNETFKKTMLNITNIEIKNGMSILDIIVLPVVHKEAKKDYDRALKGESFTKTIKMLDSFYDFTISPIFEKNQKVIGVSCFARDITEQKNMEEKLHQSEKMEAIGQLAGGIAHDFNNELSIISGYAELLRDEVKSDSDSINYIDSILQGIKRSANLISQMLAFSRKGKFLSTSVDMHVIISEISIMLTHSIDKRIKIRQKLNASSSMTLGDPTQLKSAILNLALNARDAMPDGGELLFSTEIIEINDELYKNSPYYINLGKYITVCVTDTGMGMDKQTQNRLFEPFFTTKKQGKGTGFGLASVYGTIKNHKGMINVYSEPGHGTTFKVYLPLAEISKAKTKLKTNTAKPLKISANILLVDDEEDLRIVGKKILIKLGYKVSVCKDGKEAVKFYKESWNNIDLVILDMVMPVMNGRDAFISMKKINPDIKALLTSGYSLNGEAQAILDKGVKGFLQKPFKKDELIQKITEVLEAKSKGNSSTKSKNKKQQKNKI